MAFNSNPFAIQGEGGGIPQRPGGGLRDDPEYNRHVAQSLEKKKQQSMMGRLNQGNSSANLAKMLPKLQQMQEQWKLQDAERKVKKLKLDQLLKQAEAAATQAQLQAVSNATV